MMENTCNCSTGGVEEGESGVQSHPQQLEDNLGYMKP